jgi:hypothetical protein
MTSRVQRFHTRAWFGHEGAGEQARTFVDRPVEIPVNAPGDVITLHFGWDVD